MEKDRIKRRRRAEWRNKAPEKGRIEGRHIAEKSKIDERNSRDRRAEGRLD